MKLLLLGGTAWLGRAIAVNAVDRGHQVTCLARGTTGAAPPATRMIRADRDAADACDAVVTDTWDAVIDVARQPGHVRRAALALQSVARRYLLVSSVSAYASNTELDQDEKAELLPPLDSDVMESMSQYGEAKVACERAASDVFGADRTFIARAGLIGGPGDESGRSGYWPWRFARPSSRDGTVLVPEEPDLPTAVIDVRDLASWLVRCAAEGVTGVYNAAGQTIPLSDHLAEARAVAEHSGPVVAAPSDWLVAQGVQSWSGQRSLPLWIADRTWHGMGARDTTRARAAGLLTRPLRQTLAETLDWELARPQPGPHGAGLTDQEEQELIKALLAGSRAD